jgi:hypothetical protein
MEIRLETALVWNGKDQATDCLSVSPALIVLSLSGWSYQ